MNGYTKQRGEATPEFDACLVSATAASPRRRRREQALVAAARLRLVVLVVCLLTGGCAAEQTTDEAVPERWIAEELGTRAEFRDVFFLDELRGWIVGGGLNIEGGLLGITTDGGRSWRFRSGIDRPPARSPRYLLNAVHFINPHRGFIVGDGLRILRTRDGGEHWHRVGPSGRVWAHLRDLQLVDERHGWAVGNGGLLRTTDGGETWEGPLPLDPSAARPSPISGSALHFLNRQRGWLVGKHGMIRSTADGGTTWSVVGGPPGQERADLWAVDFIDDHHGWVAGERGAIRHTSDGGWHWRAQESGVRDTLMDLDFIDRSRGWAVGFDRLTGTAVVLHTVDGGGSWSVQARVDSEAMYALFVLDERHAWAVGEQQRRSPEDGPQKLLRYEVMDEE